MKLITVVTILFMGFFVCSHFYLAASAAEEARDAKIILIEYLSKRSIGKYSECKGYLSKKFQSEFVKKFGSTYTEYYKWEKEESYRHFNILDVKKFDDLIVFKVTVEIQGPGYIEQALESYSMSYEEGHWKIVSYEIQYK